jgi:hypothetical protein
MGFQVGPAPNQTRLSRPSVSASACGTGPIRDLPYAGDRQLTTPSSPAHKPENLQTPAGIN